MTAWGRVLLSLLVLTACLAGYSSLQPDWLGRVGLEWVAADGDAGTAEDRELSAQLDRRSEVTRRRMAVKRAIIGRLAHGELTLLAAAALFREANETPADWQDPYRLLWPGKSDGEKLCRQVICWAEQEAKATSSSQAAALVARLNAELEQLLEEHGTVRLPGE
jgi:hypothetical protein